MVSVATEERCFLLDVNGLALDSPGNNYLHPSAHIQLYTTDTLYYKPARRQSIFDDVAIFFG
jgi:hypothetical protein